MPSTQEKRARRRARPVANSAVSHQPGNQHAEKTTTQTTPIHAFRESARRRRQARRHSKQCAHRRERETRTNEQTNEVTGTWPVRIDGTLGAVQTPDRQAQGHSMYLRHERHRRPATERRIPQRRGEFLHHLLRPRRPDAGAPPRARLATQEEPRHRQGEALDAQREGASEQ